MRTLPATSTLLAAVRRVRDTLRIQPIHVAGPPNAQTLLDVFAGEWASRLPPPFDGLHAGDIPLFDDERMRWSLDRFGSLRGCSVLDLGPLEGGHTYMALQAGAERVVAVEGNVRHFLRCLVVKDLLKMDAADFRLGDFMPMLREQTDEYDVVLAQGVLYHMADPVELIALTAERATRLALWTQYYDVERIAAIGPLFRRHFATPPTTVVTRGFAHTHHRFDYGLGRKLVGFYGGNQSHANWLTRDDLMAALEHFGWRDIVVGFEAPYGQRGPSLALTAVHA